MTPAITETELHRRTDRQIADQVAHAYADGRSAREVVTALAVAAMHAAEDAAHRLRMWLADGWNGDPTQVPTQAPTAGERDLLLLAGMVAAANASTLAGAVRIRQHIDRPAGWDPLRPRH